MILNTYALLVAFVGLLRLVLGLMVVLLGAAAWRSSSRASTPEARDRLENRCQLLFLLTLVLLLLNVVAWPLLYLLLQSYVAAWPGVMCIYGVTQVGTGSMGPARFLPDILALLQLTKPVLVLGGGAWFVLYLLNRGAPHAPLLTRLFVMLLPVGALAAVDAAADLAYVGIPKAEEFPTVGCCTVGFDEAHARLLPPELLGERGRQSLAAAFRGVNGALILALLVASRRTRAATNAGGLALVVLGGVVALGVTGLFVVEVAAPVLLGLPYHHCPYDLVAQAPEAIVAIALYLGGFFCLVWAGLARWLGRRGTEAALPVFVRGLLGLSLLGYLASFAMLSLELALA